MIEENDIQTIQDILNGNKIAENKLYNKYYNIVKNYIKINYPSNINIDDDVSEIMIKIFTNLNKFDKNKSKFISWVYKIAKNHMIDKWRLASLSPVKTITIDNSNSYFSCYYDCNNSTISNYDYNITRIDCSVDKILYYISTQLTSVDYEMFYMKYVDGCSYNEIACQYQLTSSTVSNKINYMKTKLKKSMLCCYI